jgi:hypothetical protein
MTAATMINGLMIFFSVTTVAVILYPLVKLTPSWLERRLNTKIKFHGDAIVALEAAIAASNDPAQSARLTAQRDFHRAALASLAVPQPTPTVTGPLPVELAA